MAHAFWFSSPSTCSSKTSSPSCPICHDGYSGALAPNTKSTYAAGPLRFTQFCDKWGITEEARMPADYALLCAFIGEYKSLQSGNSICSWLAGLRSWHIMNHAPWLLQNYSPICLPNHLRTDTYTFP